MPSRRTRTTPATSADATGARGATGEEPGGVRFPTTDGARSTSRTGADVVADSLVGVDDVRARQVRASSVWRKDYLGHLAASTALAASATASRTIAVQGLAAARGRFVWRAPDGSEEPLGAWAERPGTGTSAPSGGTGGAGRAVGTALGEERVRGTAEPLRRVEVPYRGEVLHGRALLDQLDRWVTAGTVEPGFAAAVATVVDAPELLPLPDHEVVLLGAAAAMGPLASLLRWGAQVVAVDVPVTAVQDRIRAVVAAGAGEAVLPRRPDAEVTGVDLGRDLDVLRPWLDARRAGERVPALGTYVYADGARHVELTLAADVVAQDTLAQRPDGVLVYLNTPTDAFLVEADAVRQSQERWAQRSWNGRRHRAARRASGGRLFTPAYADPLRGDDGEAWGLIDTLIDVQGPNYALAKRIQRWRGVVAQQGGHRVSSTVAPASWTRSVTSNRILAAAYAGAHRFGVEIFEPATVGPLLAAKLVADTVAPPTGAGTHPESLFSSAAAHGGLWRQPFDPRSALGVAALQGMPRTALSVVRSRRG